MITLKKTFLFILIFTILTTSVACNYIDPNSDYDIMDTEGISRENGAEIYGEIIATQDNVDFYEDGSIAIFDGWDNLNTFITSSDDYNLRGIEVGDFADVMFDELEQPNFLSYPLNLTEGVDVDKLQVVAHYYIEYERVFYEFSVNQGGGTISQITFSNISSLGDNERSGLLGEYKAKNSDGGMILEHNGRVSLYNEEGLNYAQGQFIVYDNILGMSVLTDDSIREIQCYEMLKNEDDISLEILYVLAQDNTTGEAVIREDLSMYSGDIVPVESEDYDFSAVKIEAAYESELAQNDDIADIAVALEDYIEIDEMNSVNTQIDYNGERLPVIVTEVTAPDSDNIYTYAMDEEGNLFIMDVFNLQNFRTFESYWRKLV